MLQKKIFFIPLLLFLFYSFSQLGNKTSNEIIEFDKDNPPKILMLTTKNCIYCKKARIFFEENQLPYSELDIETSEKNMNMFQLLGGTGTPLIIIEGQKISGFNETAIRAALK